MREIKLNSLNLGGVTPTYMHLKYMHLIFQNLCGDHNTSPNEILDRYVIGNCDVENYCNTLEREYYNNKLFGFSEQDASYISYMTLVEYVSSYNTDKYRVIGDLIKIGFKKTDIIRFLKSFADNVLLEYYDWLIYY